MLLSERAYTAAHASDEGKHWVELEPLKVAQVIENLYRYLQGTDSSAPSDAYKLEPSL